jgi:hypothetical protein
MQLREKSGCIRTWKCKIQSLLEVTSFLFTQMEHYFYTYSSMKPKWWNKLNLRVTGKKTGQDHSSQTANDKVELSIKYCKPNLNRYVNPYPIMWLDPSSTQYKPQNLIIHSTTLQTGSFRVTTGVGRII